MNIPTGNRACCCRVNRAANCLRRSLEPKRSAVAGSRRTLYGVPGSPVLLFFYRYFLRLGFLDGVPGLIYCGFQAVQMFHTKAKIYELKTKMRRDASQRN